MKYIILFENKEDVENAAIAQLYNKLGEKALVKSPQKIKSYAQKIIEKGEHAILDPEGETEKPPRVNSPMGQKIIDRLFKIFNIHDDQNKFNAVIDAIEAAEEKGEEFRPRARKAVEEKFNPRAYK